MAPSQVTRSTDAIRGLAHFGTIVRKSLVLASMMYASGLRRIEAVTLRATTTSILIKVSCAYGGGKGNKHRIVAVAPKLYPAPCASRSRR